MADNAQLQQVREAPSEVVNSSRETHQTVAGSLITLQVAYLRLAQSLFLS
jgi:hypothetical protein